MNKEKCLDILTKSAKLYQENLVSKEIMLIYERDRKLEYIEVQFRIANFKHLTGIESNLNAKNFYKKCKSNKLKIEEFELKKDGTTKLKLQVLEQAMSFPNLIKTIAYYDGYALHFSANMVAGNNLISYGLINNGSIYSPNSLLKKDVSTVTTKTKYRIKSIVSKKIGDAYYDTEHLAKKRIKCCELGLEEGCEIKTKISKSIL